MTQVLNSIFGNRKEEWVDLCRNLSRQTEKRGVSGKIAMRFHNPRAPCMVGTFFGVQRKTEAKIPHSMQKCGTWRCKP